MNKLRLGFFWLALGLSVIGFSQADIWYIGSNIKFDFSAGGDPVVSDGIATGFNNMNGYRYEDYYNYYVAHPGVRHATY